MFGVLQESKTPKVSATQVAETKISGDPENGNPGCLLSQA
jgi:hypothetical protein